MKHIIYILPKADYFTKGMRGSVSHAIGVATGFAKTGSRVTVISGPDPDGLLRGAHPNIEYYAIDFESSGLFGGARWMKRMFARADDLINKAQEDTVVLVRYGISNGLEIARFMDQYTPLVWGFEVNSFSTHYNTWKIRLFRWVIRKNERLSFQKARFLYVISSRLRDDLSFYGIPQGKVVVCPNAGPDPLSDMVCESRDQTKVRFAYLGVFQRYYDLPNLVRSFYQMSAEFHETAELHMFGDGEQFQQCRSEASESSNIFFHGRYELSHLLSEHKIDRQTILILPLSERFNASFVSPIKLFEYMAMGLPILASSTGQIPEILKHRETAYLYKPGSTESLKNGLQWMMDNPQERRIMAEKVKAEYADNHTWQTRMAGFKKEIKDRFFTNLSSE